MPHTRSAAKRHRQSEERRLRNKATLTELKTLKKKVLRAAHDGKPEEVTTLYRELTSSLDKAASANAIHRHAASRTKSRVAIALAKPQVVVAKTAPKNPGTVKPAPAK